MLQISNIDGGKADWISETQLIVPMVNIQTEEINRISKNSITPNTAQDTEQTLSANVTEHTLVNVSDRCLFDNYKHDVLLMPNSDLKLISNIPELKVSYNLPEAAHSKNGIIWEGNNFEKPLTKDILTVIQESSRNWNDIAKNEVCSKDITININDNKLNNDYIAETDLVNHAKRIVNENNEPQFIDGYYIEAETCDSVLVPASFISVQQKVVDNMKVQKSALVENDVINNMTNFNELFIKETTDENPADKWIKVDQSYDSFNKAKITKMNNTQKYSSVLLQESDASVISIIDLKSNSFDLKSKNYSNNTEICYTKDEKCDVKVLIENALSEKSLPLKKKAKMKKSPLNGNVNLLATSDLEITSGNTNENNKDACGEERKSEPQNGSESAAAPIETSSNSDESLASRFGRKTEKNNYKYKKRRKGCRKRSYAMNKSQVKTCGDEKRRKVSDAKLNYQVHSESSEHRYENISHLLNQLRTEKYISDDCFSILCEGLQEMKTDILQEMYNKRDIAKGIGCHEYSSHLKAFALMLHFKQPNAFKRIKDMFKNGWPPLDVIKDWKQRLNNHRQLKSNVQNDQELKYDNE